MKSALIVATLGLFVCSASQLVQSQHYQEGSYSSGGGGGGYNEVSYGGGGGGGGGYGYERPRVNLGISLKVPAMKINLGRMNMPKISIRAKIKNNHGPKVINVPEMHIDTNSKIPGPAGSQSAGHGYGHGDGYGNSYSGGESTYSGGASSSYGGGESTYHQPSGNDGSSYSAAPAPAYHQPAHQSSSSYNQGGGNNQATYYEQSGSSYGGENSISYSGPATHEQQNYAPANSGYSNGGNSYNNNNNQQASNYGGGNNNYANIEAAALAASAGYNTGNQQYNIPQSNYHEQTSYPSSSNGYETSGSSYAAVYNEPATASSGSYGNGNGNGNGYNTNTNTNNNKNNNNNNYKTAASYSAPATQASGYSKQAMMTHNTRSQYGAAPSAHNRQTSSNQYGHSGAAVAAPVTSYSAPRGSSSYSSASYGAGAHQQQQSSQYNNNNNNYAAAPASSSYSAPKQSSNNNYASASSYATAAAPAVYDTPGPAPSYSPPSYSSGPSYAGAEPIGYQPLEPGHTLITATNDNYNGQTQISMASNPPKDKHPYATSTYGVQPTSSSSYHQAPSTNYHPSQQSYPSSSASHPMFDDGYNQGNYGIRMPSTHHGSSSSNYGAVEAY